MRKIIMFVIMLAIALAPHEAEAKKRHPSQRRPAATVESTAGYADIVIDASTGRIIHETNSHEIRHPASLTKMMTLYMAFQALDSGKLYLNQYMTVSYRASSQAPSKLGLRPGQRIKVEDAILGLVTKSANDVAVVMAEAMGGSVENFAGMMTRQARALGMTKTVFRNPSGLPDPEQVTTARDMAVLGASLVSHFPRYYPYFSQDGFSYAGAYHRNHNRLMTRYDGMDGIKTGYIRASGFNLVASVKRNGTRLVAVVFGGRSAVSRDNQMAKLLDQSFSNVRFASNTHAVDQPSMNYAEQTTGEGDAEEADSYHAVSARIRKPSQNIRQAVQRSDNRPNKPQSGEWGIQIGAFRDAEIGQHALKNLASSMPQALRQADPVVQKVEVAGSTLYRARLMSLDKKTAQSVCAYLVQRGKSCLTVEP